MRINPENSILVFLSDVFDVLLAALLFVICSLPVITSGAAYTAMAAVMADVARHSGDGRVLGRFFSVFRERFRTATLCALPMLGASALLWMDCYACWGYGAGKASVALSCLKGICVVFAFVLTTLWVAVFTALSQDDITFRQAWRKGIGVAAKSVPATTGIFLSVAFIAVLWLILRIFVFPFLAAGLYLITCLSLRVLTGQKKLRPQAESNPADEEIYYE